MFGRKQMFIRPEGPMSELGANLMETNGGPMARHAVAELDLTSDSCVIEVGFGPGMGLEELARKMPLGHITGVDPSLLMHRRAKTRNALAIHEGRMALLEGNAELLPVASASYDAGLAIDNLHFWPDRRAGLTEVRRVLRPGSPFVCAFTPPSGGQKAGLSELLMQAGFIDVTISDCPEGFTVKGFAPK